jgi:arsenate reductase
MKLLFMCVANSARSQLAEGLARQRFPHAEIQSAGSHPGKLNPYAVAVMNEVGVDISNHFSKSVESLPSDFLKDLDYVITLCAEEVCPVVLSNAKRLHWPISDPATRESISEEKAIHRFREARDIISSKLKEFKP